MDNIIYLNALEGDFEYDRTLDFKKAMQQNEISLGVGATLLLSDKKNIVGMLLSMGLNYKDGNVLKYSVILTFHVDGWSDNVNFDDKESFKEMDVVGRMLDVTVGFLRGSMYVHTKNSPLEGLTLPILSLEELQKKMKVEKPVSYSHSLNSKQSL